MNITIEMNFKTKLVLLAGALFITLLVSAVVA